MKIQSQDIKTYPNRDRNRNSVFRAKEESCKGSRTNCKPFYYCPQTLEGGGKRKAQHNRREKTKPPQQHKKKLKNLKHHESSCLYLICMQGEGQPQPVSYNKL